MPTFWYNRTNEGKGAKFGTNEADVILIKSGNFHVCGRISICLFHTYIHFYLLRQDSAQLKNEKVDVDLPI